MINNIQEVMILWMEDIPMQELGSETAEMLVSGYRDGTNDYKYTMDALDELCHDELQEWIKMHYEINNLIDVSEEAF